MNWINTITQENFEKSFNLTEILKNSTFYPASGIDATNIEGLSEYTNSFVHVDYSIPENEVKRALTEDFRAVGYKLIGLRYIPESELTPNGFTPNNFPTKGSEKERIGYLDNAIKSHNPFCFWAIYEIDETLTGSTAGKIKKFSLLHIGGEACATFDALYFSNDINPRAIAILNPGEGYGDNWTIFRDPEYRLFKTIQLNSEKNTVSLPEYLFTNMASGENCFWPNYNLIDKKMFSNGNDCFMYKLKSMKEQDIITTEEIYSIKNQYNIRMENFSIDKDGYVNVDGDVSISDTKLKELPFKFGKIFGDFYCPNNELTTLKNAPTFIGGDFNCYGNKLTSLEFGPREIGGSYSCHENNLKSLTGAPKIINGNFNCFLNELTSLSDGPIKVNGNYYGNNNELISLEGSPYSVTGSFFVSANPIVNLVGCPKEIGEIFSFDNTVFLHMGNQDCKVKEVIIQLQESIPKIEKVLPQVIIDNQRHLPIVFKYMHTLGDMFSSDGEFDQSYFNDLILDIEEGLR